MKDGRAQMGKTVPRSMTDLLSVWQPFSQYCSYKFVNMEGLSIFWNLLQFFSIFKFSLCMSFISLVRFIPRKFFGGGQGKTNVNDCFLVSSSAQLKLLRKKATTSCVLILNLVSYYVAELNVFIIWRTLLVDSWVSTHLQIRLLWLLPFLVIYLHFLLSYCSS